MSLDTILSDAVTRAITFKKSTHTLGRGLIVDLRLVDACTLELKLSRKDQLPALHEYQTVLKFFPWPVDAKPHADGFSLTAQFPIHPKYISPLQDPLPLDQTGRLC